MSNNSFLLVSTIKSVRAYIGVDNTGMSSVAFDFTSSPEFELKTTKIMSRIVKIDTKYRLFISLMDDDINSKEIFEIFSNDIIYSVEKAKNEADTLNIIGNRFSYWADLFKQSKSELDEKWIRGFWGELWFLKNILSEKIGYDASIISWTGPEKANQDFITDNHIFEIKTSLQNAQTVKISNENQLSKEMILTHISISKSSELSKNSNTIYDLIVSIRENISNPAIQVEFSRKLLELQLLPLENAKKYNKFSYEYETISYYEIKNNFPIIDHNKVPKEIIRYSYDLSLSMISKYEIGEDKIWI